jgi:hypothetical protein
MTDITDEDLARIEARAVDSNEANLTPYWRVTVLALIVALREALVGVGELHYAAHSMLTDFDKCQHPICRRAARIVESSSAGLPQHEAADGVA